MGQLLDDEGALLGSDLGLSTTDCTRYDLALAYGSKQEQWLAVWYDQGGIPCRICGQRVDRDGLLVGWPIAITPDTNYEFAPAVAYNPDDDQFLVVWEGRTPRYDIIGQRVNAVSGALVDGIIRITDDADRQRAPAVVYHDVTGHYLVAWEDNRDDPGDDSNWNIYGRRLERDGSFHDASDFVVCARQENRLDVDLAYSPRAGEQGEVLAGRGIAGQRLTGTDPPLAGLDFDICVNQYEQVNPSLACNTTNGEYLVVWEDSSVGLPRPATGPELGKRPGGRPAPGGLARLPERRYYGQPPGVWRAAGGNRRGRVPGLFAGSAQGEVGRRPRKRARQDHKD